VHALYGEFVKYRVITLFLKLFGFWCSWQLWHWRADGSGTGSTVMDYKGCFRKAFLDRFMIKENLDNLDNRSSVLTHWRRGFHQRSESSDTGHWCEFFPGVVKERYISGSIYRGVTIKDQFSAPQIPWPPPLLWKIINLVFAVFTAILLAMNHTRPIY
jgi:hypothetical protein